MDNVPKSNGQLVPAILLFFVAIYISIKALCISISTLIGLGRLVGPREQLAYQNGEVHTANGYYRPIPQSLLDQGDE